VQILLYTEGQKGPGGVKKNDNDLNTTRVMSDSLCILGNLDGRSPEVRAGGPFLEFQDSTPRATFP
jgi:hypothetical protein